MVAKVTYVSLTGLPIAGLPKRPACIHDGVQAFMLRSIEILSGRFTVRVRNRVEARRGEFREVCRLSLPRADDKERLPIDLNGRRRRGALQRPALTGGLFAAGDGGLLLQFLSREPPLPGDVLYLRNQRGVRLDAAQARAVAIGVEHQARKTVLLSHLSARPQGSRRATRHEAGRRIRPGHPTEQHRPPAGLGEPVGEVLIAFGTHHFRRVVGPHGDDEHVYHRGHRLRLGLPARPFHERAPILHAGECALEPVAKLGHGLRRIAVDVGVGPAHGRDHIAVLLKEGRQPFFDPIAL